MFISVWPKEYRMKIEDAPVFNPCISTISNRSLLFNPLKAFAFQAFEELLIKYLEHRVVPQKGQRFVNSFPNLSYNDRNQR